MLLPTSKDTQGPHAKKFIRVYVNKVGEKQMTTRKNPRFPVGSVIVKQKLPLNSKVSKTKFRKVSPAPELLTVMIKHKAGYDPKNGDWEYMVTDGAGRKVSQRGQIESCQNCHRPYAKTDYVVRSYLPKEVRIALNDLNAVEAQSKNRSEEK
ncbi:hypothetical protein EON80_33105 [bacterium]|nr:MAG: hypothetical protein EON80_33105 [bacterium]